MCARDIKFMCARGIKFMCARGIKFMCARGIKFMCARGIKFMCAIKGYQVGFCFYHFSIEFLNLVVWYFLFFNFILCVTPVSQIYCSQRKFIMVNNITC